MTIDGPARPAMPGRALHEGRMMSGITDYEEIVITSRPTPLYHRHYRGASGAADAIVQTFGASWGFTIWDGTRCLDGAKDWNWTRDDAIDRASAMLLELCGDRV